MKKVIFIVILTFILAIYIILDIYFTQQLFKQSVKQQYWLQQNIHTKFLNYVFLFFAFIGKGEFIGILVLIWIVFSKKREVIITFLAYYSFTIYVCFILKLLFHDPRPFWVNPKLIGLTKSLGYGHPSGHALGTLIFYFMFYKIQVYDTKLKNGLKFFGFICFCIIYIMICLSRIYLNVHGTNQVMLGFILGGYLLIIYLIALEDIFLRILYNMDQTCYEKTSFKIKRMLTLILIYIIMLSLPIAIYLQMKNTVVMKQQWIKNIELQWGKIHAQKPLLKLVRNSVQVSTLGLTIFFAYLLKSQNDKVRLNEDQESEVFYNSSKMVKKIVRFLIYILILSAILVVFKLIPYKNYVIKLIVQAGIGNFLLVLALINFIPALLKKLGIANKEDHQEFVYEKPIDFYCLRQLQNQK